MRKALAWVGVSFIAWEVSFALLHLLSLILSKASWEYYLFRGLWLAIVIGVGRTLIRIGHKEKPYIL